MKRKAPQLPKVRALYDYAAQDTDEISLVEGEVVELIREGTKRKSKGVLFLESAFLLDESGWWTGRTTGGLEGFFPGTYVEKIAA